MQGYQASILFMLSMPFLLLGGIGGLLWRAARVEARRAAEAAAARNV